MFSTPTIFAASLLAGFGASSAQEVDMKQADLQAAHQKYCSFVQERNVRSGLDVAAALD